MNNLNVMVELDKKCAFKQISPAIKRENIAYRA